MVADTPCTNAVGIKNKQPDRTCLCDGATAYRRTESLIIVLLLLLLYERGACVRVKPEIRRGSRCDAHNTRIIILYIIRLGHTRHICTHTYVPLHLPI